MVCQVHSYLTEGWVYIRVQLYRNVFIDVFICGYKYINDFKAIWHLKSNSEYEKYFYHDTCFKYPKLCLVNSIIFDTEQSIC